MNAHVGDALAATGSELALAITLRHRGADLPLDADGPARAVPETAPRLAIFAHRLGETDASWGLRADAQRPGYNARPQRDLGHTPIDVHHNTRLHISDNGRVLAGRLEEAHKAWPAAIAKIVIVGHTIGGLVARSACHYGHSEGHGWTSAVRHVFGPGSPHLGAPLENSLNAPGWAPAASPRRGRRISSPPHWTIPLIRKSHRPCAGPPVTHDRCISPAQRQRPRREEANRSRRCLDAS